jgi:hypothetical protein
VFDIYHESIQRYGNPGCLDRFLPDALHQIDVPDCFFHHHSRDSIFEYFDSYEAVFATLLRDPVDRFVSDVFHFRRFFRNGADRRLVDGIAKSWSAEFGASLREADVPVDEVLRLAIREPSFRNFYVQFFAGLCWGESARGLPVADTSIWSARAIGKLAADMRRRFQVIGWFGNLHCSLAEIQEAFGLPSGGPPLTNRINIGHDRPGIRPSDRSHFAAAFDADYRLLDELRMLSPLHKSIRRWARSCRSFLPVASTWVDEDLPLPARSASPHRTTDRERAAA